MSGRNSNTSAERKAKDDWRTPRWLWDILNEQYRFEIDCAASEENHLCPLWIGAREGTQPVGLVSQKLCGWVNPPFSDPWMLQNFWISLHKRVGIYRCDNLETKVWQQLIWPNVDWVFFFFHRINYEGHEGKGAMFPSAIFSKGCPPPVGLEGTCVRL